jgi:hypothetical protein
VSVWPVHKIETSLKRDRGCEYSREILADAKHVALFCVELTSSFNNTIPLQTLASKTELCVSAE